MDLFIDMCMYIYMCMSMYMYMHMCIYTMPQKIKPIRLHIRRHYTKSSHRALRSYSLREFVGGDIPGLFQVFIYFQAASLRYFSWF